MLTLVAMVADPPAAATAVYHVTMVTLLTLVSMVADPAAAATTDESHVSAEHGET